MSAKGYGVRFTLTPGQAVFGCVETIASNDRSSFFWGFHCQPIIAIGIGKSHHIA